ncbi:hypothetical protein [Bradyrhizobium sp. USDA 223]|uniref:hypothetical protein n=1 Tax=Bradyrhizobium sp. USDA 223 TaxID=3156306 RepID=UPI0038331FC7
MTTSNMSASSRVLKEPVRVNEVRCPPMSHQNSGDHGHEAYPQQFVRLIGCHDVPASQLRKRQDEKLH